MHHITSYLRRYRWLLFLFVAAVSLALALPSFGQQANRFELRILHTNDHHARIEPVRTGDRTLGGVAQRMTLIKQIRAASTATKEPVLLLDAGDIFQGTLYFNQYLGMADLEFYNAMGYDASTIGNHEFDRGPETLAKFIDGAKFPVISANINIGSASPLSGRVKRWITKDINGEKIGIFGLTTEDTPVLASPGPGVDFTSAVTAAREAVAELQALGVNKIIALTHVGFAVDQQIAQQVNGVDIIIGGHSHTPVGNIPGTAAPYPLVSRTPNSDPVLIVTDWEWGKFLGDLNVVFDRQGKLVSWAGRPIAVDSSITPDPEFVSKIEQYAAPIKAFTQQTVARTAVDLTRGDRTLESNLANLITDAILAKTRPAGAQVVIMNTGGIRTDIPAGEITVGQILENMPFGNTVALVDITGSQIKAALENGLSQVENRAGRFAQVSGLRYVWNPQAPVGSRVVDVQVRSASGGFQPLDPNATYRVATNNFMLNGGDGYAVFTQGRNPVDTGFILTDVLIDYLKANSPANPQIEGRIVRGTQPFSR